MWWLLDTRETLMEPYYAYENWRANGGHSVTKVHRHDCKFCNNGQGFRGGTDPANGRWFYLGKFTSPEDASVAARDQVSGGTVQCCGICCAGPRS